MNRIWHINELDQLIDYVKANQGNKNIILAIKNFASRLILNFKFP